eukprot:4389067-Prorocentrum_lima.AAC.1
MPQNATDVAPGFALYGMRDLAGAEAAFFRALRDNPTRSSTWCNLGDVLVASLQVKMLRSETLVLAAPQACLRSKAGLQGLESVLLCQTVQQLAG